MLEYPSLELPGRPVQSIFSIPRKPSALASYCYWYPYRQTISLSIWLGFLQSMVFLLPVSLYGIFLSQVPSSGLDINVFITFLAAIYGDLSVK